MQWLPQEKKSEIFLTNGVTCNAATLTQGEITSFDTHHKAESTGQLNEGIFVQKGQSLESIRRTQKKCQKKRARND